ncbi:hypothetical protein ACFYYR_05820 [Streptomyces sp. NPDC001922]|uniref:hypothetical protein n=1 Tax=Streptomyces sp. NPDC001922 TaxID=3364624 RepID=UPI0036AA8DEC
MQIQPVDPRDSSWEQDHAVYRVSFLDTVNNQAHDFEISNSPVEDVLLWTREFAGERGLSYTLYVKVTDGGQQGLVRISGVPGDLSA